jgi:hypothetical protein
VNIIKDISNFEFNYIYTNKIDINVYENIEEFENIELLIKIFKILKENKKIFKNSNLNKISKEIDSKIKIDFKIFKEIENTDEIIIAYLTLFILISLNPDSNKMIANDSFKLNNISDCCNKVEYLSTKFKIFLKMKHNIDIEQINYKDTTKIFYFLIDKQIIKHKNLFRDNKTIKFIYIDSMNYIYIKEIYTTNFKCFEYKNDLWLYNTTF